MKSALSVLTIAALLTACQSSRHARVTSFSRPPLPAGFVEQSGAGWRIAVPSTWNKDLQAPGPPDGAVVYADPQIVDDYHSNVSVVRQPFSGDSYEYADVAEQSIRHEPRAALESARDDVIDGDRTFVVESRWAPMPPGKVAYRSMQTALASRSTGYLVTCSAAVSAFERYRSTCDAVMRSFAVER